MLFTFHRVNAQARVESDDRTWRPDFHRSREQDLRVPKKTAMDTEQTSERVALRQFARFYYTQPATRREIYTFLSFFIRDIVEFLLAPKTSNRYSIHDVAASTRWPINEVTSCPIKESTVTVASPKIRCKMNGNKV